jgi:hypothetical protein
MSENTYSKTSGKNDDIDKEVNQLLKKAVDTNAGKSKFSIVQDLKMKYRDEQIVDSVLGKYTDKLKKVKKLAEKIRERLVSKYPNLSLKEYIEKITEYKKKYNFDDTEMNAIIALLFQNKPNLAYNEILDIQPNEMSKALGFQPVNQYTSTSRMSVKPEEMEHLQGILTLNSATKELHTQVSLQSLVYEEGNPQALTVSFDKHKVNVFSYIHPVVVALFLPKIEFLDRHMILASISNIVALRYNGQPLATQPDYELYMDIATDPAETACVSGGQKVRPFADLLNRANLQAKLWESILNLRQGKYYTNDLTSFIAAIDSCRGNVFDAADLAYVKDEGTILRKLFSAFSIRPTIVSTAPVYTVTTLTSPLSPITATHITTVPMITMRLMVSTAGLRDNRQYNLTDALTQQQIFIHHRQLTAKTQDIMYSRDLLVFYIHRRYQHINIAKVIRPYDVQVLPVTMSQNEKIHTAPVNFSRDMTVGSQEFRLKSVIALVTGQQNFAISSCAMIILEDAQNSFGNSGLIYEPLELVSHQVDAQNSNKSGLIYPLTEIPIDGNNDNIESIMSVGKTKGTLFIYTTKDSGLTFQGGLFTT